MQEKWAEEEEDGRKEEEEEEEEEDMLHHQIRNREMLPRKERWGEGKNKRAQK